MAGELSITEMMQLFVGFTGTGKSILEAAETYSGKTTKVAVKAVAAGTVTAVSKLNDNFRDVIDKSVPNIYLIDTEVMAKLVVKFLDPGTFTKEGTIDFRQIVSSYTHLGETTHTAIYSEETDEYDDMLADYSDYYNSNINNTTFIQKLQSKLYERLSNEVLTKTISFEGMVEACKEAQIAIVTSRESIAALKGTHFTAEVLLTSIASRAILKAGAKLKVYFSKNTPAQVKSPEDIVVGFKPKVQILAVGSSFTGLRDVINEKASKAVQEVVMNSTSIKFTAPSKDANTLIKRQFFGSQIGKLVASGHVAAVYLKDGIKQVISANTPLTIGTLAKLHHVGVEQGEIISDWVHKSGHIDLAIEFHQNVREGVSVLGSMGIVFTTSQDSPFNSGLLQNSETKGMVAVIEKTFGENIQKKITGIKRNLTNPQILGKVTELHNSPTLRQNITMLIVNALDPKQPKPKPSTSVASASISRSKSRASGTPNKVTLSKVPLPTTSVLLPKNTIRRKTGQLTSLASIQVLLNQALSTKIKENMVTPALNNRTGRFAESAKVENMSQSRQGMITAFYSYMKNPYQTFEPGFAQGSERRNPKTLISKSIREIASGLVGNRLRAVSI